MFLCSTEKSIYSRENVSNLENQELWFRVAGRTLCSRQFHVMIPLKKCTVFTVHVSVEQLGKCQGKMRPLNFSRKNVNFNCVS